jgi:hypothetical protein
VRAAAVWEATLRLDASPGEVAASRDEACVGCFGFGRRTIDRLLSVRTDIECPAGVVALPGALPAEVRWWLADPGQLTLRMPRTCYHPPGHVTKPPYSLVRQARVTRVYFGGGATRIKVLVLRQTETAASEATFEVVAVRELPDLLEQPGGDTDTAPLQVRVVALDPPLVAPQGKQA